MEEEKLQSFKYWKAEEVENTFGISLEDSIVAMDEWLATDCIVSEKEKEQLDFLQSRLRTKVQDWNEAALQFYFLGPLMNLVLFDSKQYNSFLEAKLTVQIGNQIVQGNIDFMVATGRQTPRAPFYTLHEYKSEPNFIGDPMGQLLIAMVAAQKRNEEKGLDVPLYGTYVLGRFFFFVYFHKNRYTKSLAYDATQEDLFKIFCIIKKVKTYIDENLAKMSA